MALPPTGQKKPASKAGYTVGLKSCEYIMSFADVCLAVTNYPLLLELERHQRGAESSTAGPE